MAATLYLKDYLPLLKRAEECEYKSPSEEDFLESLRDQHEDYGDATRLSEKQLEWLTNIAERD